MKPKFHIFTALFVVVFLLSLLGSCVQMGTNTSDSGAGDGATDAGSNLSAEDIVVLYTNDVHCAIDENIGYAGLAAYKKLVEQRPRMSLSLIAGMLFRATRSERFHRVSLSLT